MKPARQGMRLRRVVLLMGLTLFGAFILSLQVWRQNQYVRLTREGLGLDREIRKSENAVAALEMDVKALMRRQRLEKLAVDRFGLAYAGAPEWVGEQERQTDPSKVAFADFGDEKARPGQWIRGAVAWLTNGL